jgi:hypothetical protein
MKAVLAIVAVVATLAVLATVSTTVPASAQGKPGRGPTTPPGPEPKKKVDDKGYKSSLERIPDQKYDPWGKIR